ncbi:hypothetical protein [Haloarcula salinisoli]|uniref:DUF7979 domain-containing protein n=1 Tax=Haloarcula salinisoli TaxID=2487746 RepID=A0A8J8C9C4_9EURY|nr:hypothetical protein [Halomicroarcula salinisoli]MBX0305187.1 hypothetical protein [Halomicroarcula salinisoli]
MPPRRRIATAILAVGLLCLPAPLYLPYGLAMVSPETTDAPYHGPEVAVDDPSSNDIRLDGTPTRDQRVLLRVEELGFGYDDPDGTRAVLTRAARNGTATTADPTVRSDLRRLDWKHEFVSWDRPPASPAVRTDVRPRTPAPPGSAGDGTQRYALSVRNNGSTVTLTEASAFQVFDATVGGRVVAYDSLRPETRRAVDAIVANTTDGRGEYHPRADSPVVDRAPLLVEKNGTVYNVYRDDGTYIGGGFARFLLGGGVAVVGLILVAIGLVGRHFSGRT